MTVNVPAAELAIHEQLVRELDLGLVMLARSADNPLLAHMGRHAIDAVLNDYQ
jgi:hypothetical protein